MKILIIEDDKENRDYVSTGLKEAGHNIDSAREAIKARSCEIFLISISLLHRRRTGYA
jgi:DNA-binding response OmpR family regulator